MFTLLAGTYENSHFYFTNPSAEAHKSFKRLLIVFVGTYVLSSKRVENGRLPRNGMIDH
jgi:hypothetical protein